MLLISASLLIGAYPSPASVVNAPTETYSCGLGCAKILTGGASDAVDGVPWPKLSGVVVPPLPPHASTSTIASAAKIAVRLFRPFSTAVAIVPSRLRNRLMAQVFMASTPTCSRTVDANVSLTTPQGNDGNLMISVPI